MSTVFFLYHFNDVDQICPVIWKLAQRGERTAAVMLDPSYDIAGDPRLDFLQREGSFQAMSVTDVFPGLGIGWLFRQRDGRTCGLVRRALRKVLRELGVSVGWAEAALTRLGAEVCVFEWGGEGGRNRTEFLRAARKPSMRACL